MKDPVRWREESSGADAETRALLLGDKAVGPSCAEQERVWSSLAPQLQAIPAPTHAAPVAPAAAGTNALVGKITLGVVLVAAVGAGVGLHHMRAREQPARPMPSAKPSVRPLPPPEAVAEQPAAPALAKVASPVEKTTRPRARASVMTTSAAKSPEALPASPALAAEAATNELLEEGRRLARARAALRAHDPERALALLQTGAAGTAALAQEREALTIEALASRPSSRAQAAERARAFMRAYPDSPYRARIKAMVFENP